MGLNIKEDSFLLNGKLMAVFNKGIYQGNTCEIIDNTSLFSGEYVSCYNYISENIRCYCKYTPVESISYLSKFFNSKFDYKLYEYKKEELSRSRIINDLHHVIYLYSPKLTAHTCVGWTSGLVEDDPNKYDGEYVLNDGNTYQIIKVGNKYEFRLGKDVIYQNIIEWNTYKLGLEINDLRRKIVVGANRLLDNGELINMVSKYSEGEKRIKMFLETLNFMLTFKQNDDIL